MRRKAVKKKAAKRGYTFYGRRPSAVRARPSKVATARAKKHTAKAKKHFVKNLVFVGMSFSGEGMDDVYSAIKDSCTALGLDVNRIDEHPTSGLVVLEMVKAIQDAEYLIFDLTYERPNVYYELGFAHGCGNEATDILLVARAGTDMHFDVAGFRIRFYRGTEELRRIVRDTLPAMKRAAQ